MLILKCLALAWGLTFFAFFILPWLLTQHRPLRGSREDQFANWQRRAYTE